MRTLQVSKFFWPVMGGIETVTWELTEGLNRVGIHTDVVCSHQQLRTSRETFHESYEVVRAGSLGMLHSTSIAPPMIPLLRSLAADRDIVHVHMPDPMAAAAIFAVRPRGKLVVHWHNDVVRQRHAMHMYRPLQNWLLRRADAVIATSEAYAAGSAELRPWQRKVVVIPIGITDNRTAARDEKIRQIRRRFGGRKIVFSLGRMSYYKGFEVLIEVAAGLPEDSVVIIGGDGELLDTFREKARQSGQAHKVHFVGQIDYDELPSYYYASDVYCMASTVRAEAYGVALLEAMVMGKPIVASDIPGSGVPWVNSHGVSGFNTPVGDVEAISSALRQLLENDELRNRMGVLARARYEQVFDSELMIGATANLYRRLLNEQ